jgi:hypothetical protein
LHHVIDLLNDAYSRLKREAAPGVDGRTWQSYKQNLEVNLAELHSRIHRGTYRALPSRRRYIPKSDGRQRPLGIAALEDRIVQRAVVEVLNAIYEALRPLGKPVAQAPCRGRLIIVRFADDIVIGFEHEGEARPFLADMRQRMEKFALSLHPGKTRLMEFGRYAAAHRARRGLGKPETFNFLGFTHMCSRSSRASSSSSG